MNEIWAPRTAEEADRDRLRTAKIICDRDLSRYTEYGLRYLMDLMAGLSQSDSVAQPLYECFTKRLFSAPELRALVRLQRAAPRAAALARKHRLPNESVEELIEIFDWSVRTLGYQRSEENLVRSIEEFGRRMDHHSGVVVQRAGA
ncbi:MAG: hypothetical protein AAF416_14445 [Pseudomonadota bacterium]